MSHMSLLVRVQRLAKCGYILRYEARLNPLKFGAPMELFVEVLLDRTSANKLVQFEAAVQVRAEIMECHQVAVASTTCSRSAALIRTPTSGFRVTCCGSCPACVGSASMR